SGTFSAVGKRLAYLADLGITAVELMPVADFPGQRNWGYDGVFPFAPDSTYGRPEDLKELVQSAHDRGLMVFLDVVYNHFGPEGNYLRSYAPQFFTDRHSSPWGDGINFDSLDSRAVRDFFIHNALFWLTEYHFDGLRLDAVHAIIDDSTPHILTELADAVRNSVEPDRHVHLILENDQNQARYLQRTERGLPPTAFVSFLQNHDQVGNRAFGERIIQIADHRAVRAAVAILLLAPSPPLLFMGEEFGAETPFLFFCDFEKDLAAAITAGRRNEFAHFARFNDPAERERIPDPGDTRTFKASQPNWSLIVQPGHRDWLRFYRTLLDLRCERIVSRLATGCAVNADYEVHGDRGLAARWKFSDQSELILMANLGTDSLSGLIPPASQVIYASEQVNADVLKRKTLPAWSVVWFLES